MPCELLVSLTSLFCALFNFTAVGYAIVQLRLVYGDGQPLLANFVNSAALWGSTIGMCLMGFVGDCLGRSKGMTLTICLILIGSLGSAVCTIGNEGTILRSLAACRFILGIGVGGVFPLSAVSAGESAGAHLGTRTQYVGYAFLGMPIANAIAPFLISFLLLVIGPPSVAWRVILGAGALPAVIVLLMSFRTVDSKEFLAAQERTGTNPCGTLFISLRDVSLRRALLGTAGSWFMFDLAWYGLTICMPTITEEVLRIESEALIALFNALMMTLSIPLNLLLISLVAGGRLNLKSLQTGSFAFMAITFSVLAAAISLNMPRSILIVSYTFVILSVNCGPGLTNYALPQEVFPIEVKSSMNGISAAAGKLGAALGVTLFEPIQDAYGLPVTLLSAGACQIVGLFLTYMFIPCSNDLASFRSEPLSELFL